MSPVFTNEAEKDEMSLNVNWIKFEDGIIFFSFFFGWGINWCFSAHLDLWRRLTFTFRQQAAKKKTTTFCCIALYPVLLRNHDSFQDTLLSVLPANPPDKLFSYIFINYTVSFLFMSAIHRQHQVEKKEEKESVMRARFHAALLQVCVSSFKVAFIQGRGPMNKGARICIRCMLSEGEGAVKKKRCQRWTKRTRTNPSLWGWWEKRLVWIGEWVKIDRERFQAGSLWG